MRVISSNTTSASEGGIPTSARVNERRRGVNRSVLVFLYVLDTTLPTSPRLRGMGVHGLRLFVPPYGRYVKEVHIA